MVRVFEVSLALQRYRAVADILDEHKVERFADVGCGEGKGLAEMLSMRSPVKWSGADGTCTTLRDSRLCRFMLGVGLDLDHTQFSTLESAKAGNPYMPLHMSLWGVNIITDDLNPLRHFLEQNAVDAISCIEVLEHVNPEDVDTFSDTLFTLLDFAKVVVVTTPNIEANVPMGMAPGTFRHPDHRFEWTAGEFAEWGINVAKRHGYVVSFSGVGGVVGPGGKLVYASSLATFIPISLCAEDSDHPNSSDSDTLISPPTPTTALCNLPCCKASGGCAWKGKSLTKRTHKTDGVATEIVFSSMPQSWLAYDVCSVVYDMLAKMCAEQREEPTDEKGWVNLTELVGTQPIPRILEHSPDFLVEAREASEEDQVWIQIKWVIRCFLEAQHEVAGLVLWSGPPYEQGWVRIAGCKWCGENHRETCKDERPDRL